MMREQRLEAKRKFHWTWLILAICFVDLFVNYSVRLGYGVVLPQMIRTVFWQPFTVLAKSLGC